MASAVFRTYRSAIASARGPVGEALTRQLLLSPLCSEVRALGPVARKEFEGLSASKKLNELGSILDLPQQRPVSGGATSSRLGDDSDGGEGLSSVYAAFFVVGDGRWATPARIEEAKAFAARCSEAQVPHVTLLSSIWAEGSFPHDGPKIHAEIVETFKAAKMQRLSVFQPSFVCPGEGPSGSTTPGAESLEKGFAMAFPVARQFLPSRYREVTLADLVLAMRLNVELCQSQEAIEMLTFPEMMSIIGKEDTV